MSDRENPSSMVPASPFFHAWARFVVKHRWLFLIGTLLLTLAAAQQAGTRLRIDNRTESLIADDSDAALALKELRKEFGDDNLFMILIEGDVFSMQYLERLEALHQELAVINIELSEASSAIQGNSVATDATLDEFGDFGADEGWGDEKGGTVVDEIVSLINVRRVNAEAGGVTVEGLLDEWPTAETLPALKEYVLSEKSYVGQVVGAAGKHSVIVLRTQLMDERDTNKVYKRVREITNKHDQDGFRIQIAGMPALNSSLNEMILADTQNLVGLALLVMLVVLFVIFRHPWGIFGPLLVVVLAIIWTYGAMAISGIPSTTITAIMPVLLICVGIGDSIHLQSVYRDTRRQGLSNNEAIIDSVAKIGIPILFTSVTTALGMASFKFASLRAVQELGLISAFGVMAGMLHSLVFLPIILSFNKKSLLGAKPRKDKQDWLDRLLERCNRLSGRAADGPAGVRKRARSLMAVCAGLAIAAVFGITTLTVSHNALTWFPSGHEMPRAFEDIDEHVGGAAILALLIEGKGERGIKDRELLLGLEKLDEHISAYQDPAVGQPIVMHSLSVLDLIRESWRALHGMEQESYRIPEMQRGVSDVFTVVENAEPEQLKRLVTLDGKKAVMTIRVRWLDAGSYRPLAEHVREGIDKYIGDKAVIKTTGTVFTALSVFDRVVLDLLSSFGSAFVVITLIMIVLLRDWKLGLLAMLPNLLPVATVMAFMGIVGIPLDLNTLLIAPIAIAIAVDDTIHFLHQFKSHYERNKDTGKAVKHAFDHAGRAIVSTSVIITAGFSVYLAATMYNVKLLGILVGLTVLWAVIFDLIMTPAFLKMIFHSPSRERNAK